MRRLMKVLSALLCMALLISGAPADMLLAAVYAEEVAAESVTSAVESEAVEAPAVMEAPAVVEAPAEVPVEEEISEAVAEDESEQVPAEEEPSVDEPVAEEDPNAIDYSANAGESKAFTVGLAEVLKKDTPVYVKKDASSDVKVALSKGVVYVIGRSEEDPDRLEIVFNAGPVIGIDGGWVDAARVRPMEPVKEVSAYIEFCSDLENIIYYKDDAKLPLAWIGCAYPEAAVKPVATATPVPPIVAVETPAPVETEHAVVEMPTVEATEHPVMEMPEPEATEHPVIALPEADETNQPAAEVPVLDVTEQPVAEEPEAKLEPAEDPQPTESVPEEPADEGEAEEYATMAAADMKLVAMINETGPITLSPGMKKQLNYTVTEGAAYQPTSSDNKVASVSNTGVVTALMPGEATITLKVNGAAQDSWNVRVLAAPDVVLSQTSCKLGVGDTFDLSKIVSASPKDTPAAYTYKVKSGAGFASVNTSTGVVKAKKAGTAKIRVTNSAGKYKDFKVTVYKAATKLSKFGLADETLGVEMTTKLTVAFPAKTYLDYTLESSNEKVATIAEDGTVTAIAPGKTTISFKPTNAAKSKLAKSVTLVVLPAPETITLKASSEDLVYGIDEKDAAVIGDSGKDAMCAFTYSSSDTDIATVNKTTGVLTLKDKGTVKITAKASNSDAKADVTLTVVPGPTGISFTTSTLLLGKGDTYQLAETTEGGIIKLAPSDASASYTYKVKSGGQYVTVSKTGLITAKKKGTAKIRVYTQKTNVYKDLKVQVYTAATNVKLSSATLKMGQNMKRTLTVSFNKKTSYADYKFKSDNEDIVSVDAAGNLTTHDKTGKATITVETTSKKLTDKCVVTVLPAPETISLTASKSTLVYGAGEKDASVAGDCGESAMCDFEYSSSNTKVATVNKTTGALTLNNEGTVKITAKASNSDATASVTLTVLPRPTKVEFTVSTLKMGKGDTYPLTETTNGGIIKLTPSGASASYTYKVKSGGQYVTVSKTGLITAKKKGTAKIRVYTQDPKVYKDLKVTVYAAPTSAKLNAPAKMGIGMSGKLSVTFNKSSAYSICTFESSNPEVVSVDATGAIKALSAGTAKITLTVKNKKADECTIEVLPAPDKVSIRNAEYTISAGMTLALAGEVKIPSGTMAGYTYAPSNKSVATVDANGNIKGLKKGDVTITVETHNHMTASAKVHVTAAPSTIKFVGLPKQLNISKGDVITIPTPVAYDASGNVVPATFTYQSSNKSIVKVSGNKMAGVKKSNAVVTITATAHNKKKGTFKVRVYANAVSGVELAHSSYKLYIRDGYTDSVALNGTVTGTNLNYGSITYKSSNEKVATVSESGVVTGVGTGSATITATAKDGAQKTCEITVGTLSSTLAFAESAEGLVLTEGTKYKLKPKFDADTGSRLTYKSSDAKKVTVDENGNLEAVAPGSVKITVEGQNGLKAEIEVTVLYSPTRITLPAAELYMQPGENITLKATLLAEVSDMKKVNTELSYNASAVNSKVVSVEDDGKGNYKVTAVGNGTTTLQITTCNGLTASCKFHVGTNVPTLGFPKNWADEVAIVVGDSAALNLALSVDVLKAGYDVVSSNESALKVSADKQTIKAAAVASSVTLTLMVGGKEVDKRVVQVVSSAKPTFSVNGKTVTEAIDMDVPSYTASVAKHELVLANLPRKPLIGTFEMSYDLRLLADYDWANQMIATTSKTGTTNVYVKTYSGEATIEVNVLGAPVYRALLLSEYNGAGGSTALPFAQTNIEQMEGALANSNIGGQKYKTPTVLKNPSEAQIKSGIESTFKGAKRNDVSFIYIVAHGHMNKTTVNGSSAFYFSMPGYSTKNASTMITDDELMSWIKPIEGNVVLVMCCCNSGAFISHQKSTLASAGNIAVLTAQVASKTASFYVKYKGIETHEFFTRAVYTGMGNPFAAGDKWDTAKNADLVGGNKDGLISVSELFNYSQSQTVDMVNTYAKPAYFVAGQNKGFTSPGLSTAAKALTWRNEEAKAKGKGQLPQMYIPNALKDLPIIGY